MTRRVVRILGAALALSATATLSIYLIHVGLDQADKVSSITGVFLTIIGLLATLYGDSSASEITGQRSDLQLGARIGSADDAGQSTNDTESSFMHVIRRVNFRPLVKIRKLLAQSGGRVTIPFPSLSEVLPQGIRTWVGHLVYRPKLDIKGVRVSGGGRVDIGTRQGSPGETNTPRRGRPGDSGNA
ncbi:hypothetical protein, partial [Streptomyces phaeochromogenes]